MFCPQCGKGNQETAAFCIYCGNRLPASNSWADAKDASNNTQRVAVGHESSYVTTDTYRNLGGWLAIICYGRLLSAALGLVICIAVTFISTCFRYFQNGSRIFVGLANFAEAAAYRGISGKAIFCYGGLLVILLYVLLVCCSIVLHRKIKKRQSNCMRFYRGATVVISCAAIAVLVAGYLLTKPVLGVITQVCFVMQIMPIAAIAIWLILDMVISLLFFSVYFKTSKRVSVYFEAK